MKHVRGAVLAVALLASLAACTDTTKPPSGQPSGKTPVVFIHGYVLSPSMWDSFVAYLKTKGYTSGDIMNVGYVSTGAQAVNATQGAAQLAARVDQILASTGKTKVDIIGHSLGNLMIKTCIVQGGCKNKINHWENVGGAQNGTSIANLCFDPACTDMRPGSALIRQLQAADDAAIAEQGVKVQVHWTQTDGIIVPPTNSQEPYANNIQITTPGINHLNMADHRPLQEQTLAFFNS